LANSELRLSSVETRYNGGQVSDLELLKAKEAIANVESALEDSQGQVEALSALLNNLLALERTVEVDVEGEFAYEPKDMAIEESFLLALEERPEIKQYEAQTNAAKEGVELAKANGRPTVYASWDYYSSSHLATGAENWNDYNIYGVTVSWPIFDGWATKAKLDQAITDVKTAQLLQEKLVQDIALELKNAYVEMKNAIAQVRKSETALSTFTKDLEEIKDKTAKGIASHLDLEDAKLSYKIALFNKDQAVYNYLIAQNAFDKASGAFENQQ
jgi:outer membrane protein TolC